jgi:hypothetical protein
MYRFEDADDVKRLNSLIETMQNVDRSKDQGDFEAVGESLSAMLGVPFIVEGDGKKMAIGHCTLKILEKISQWLKKRQLEFVNENKFDPNVYKVAYDGYVQSLSRREFEHGGVMFTQLLNSMDNIGPVLSIISSAYDCPLTVHEASAMFRADPETIGPIYFSVITESFLPKALWRTKGKSGNLSTGASN